MFYTSASRRRRSRCVNSPHFRTIKPDRTQQQQRQQHTQGSFTQDAVYCVAAAMPRVAARYVASFSPQHAAKWRRRIMTQYSAMCRIHSLQDASERKRRATHRTARHRAQRNAPNGRERTFSHRKRTARQSQTAKWQDQVKFQCGTFSLPRDICPRKSPSRTSSSCV